MMHQGKPNEHFFDFPLLSRAIALQRRRAGLSQADLASQISIPVKLLAAYEEGTVRVRAVRLVEIEKALNVPILSLFTEPDQ